MPKFRELPLGIDGVPELVRLLNEQIREQVDEWDAEGSRISNVGAPQDRTDALSLEEGDRRYLKLGWQPPASTITESGNNSGGGGGTSTAAAVKIHRNHTMVLLDTAVGNSVLSHRFRVNLPVAKYWKLINIEASSTTAASGDAEIRITRRRLETDAFETIFYDNIIIPSTKTRGDILSFKIQELFNNDEINVDIISNGGLSDITLQFLGEVL